MPTKTDIPLSERAAHLRMAIVRTARRLRQEAAAETTGLTPTSVAALATIERHGPLTPSEVAEIERVKRPTITRTLACLDARGWSTAPPTRPTGAAPWSASTAPAASGCGGCAAARTPTWRGACAT